MMSRQSEEQRLRLSQWSAQADEYNSRPDGMSMNAWCRSKGIPASTFAARLKKLQAAGAAGGPAFVEIPAAAARPAPEAAGTAACIAAITCGNMRIEVAEDISDSFLLRIMKAARHAE